MHLVGHLVKWVLVAVGAAQVVLYIMPRIVSADFYRIGAKLQALDYVSAYQYSVYGSEILYSLIWLKEDGYVRSENIRVESFNNPSVDVIYQIGDSRIYCLSDDPQQRPLKGYEPFVTVTQLSAALDGRYDRSLTDFLADYELFKDLVSNWPETEEDAFKLELSAEKLAMAGIEYGPIFSRCWKNQTVQPLKPLERNISFQKNGVWFFRGNN